jgi:hypothetical protein
MDPPIEVIDNLRRLCVDILQPLREYVGVPITISSGFRPLELNTLIGGSTTSAHMDGRAADIIIEGIKPLSVAQTIEHLGLHYDQVIHEFRQWVHVGISPEEVDIRLQKLTATRDSKGVHYELGLA